MGRCAFHSSQYRIMRIYVLHNINRTGGKIFQIKSRSYAVFRNLLGSQVLKTRTDKKEQWRKTILFNHLI